MDTDAHARVVGRAWVSLPRAGTRAGQPNSLYASTTRQAGSPVVYVCWAKMLTGLWAACGATLLSRGGGGKTPPTPPSPGPVTRRRAAEEAKGAEGAGASGGRGAAERSVRLLLSQV